MKKVVLLILVGFSCSWVSAGETGFGKVFMGTVDTFRENQDTQYGVEYQFAHGYSRYDFKPVVGLLRTRDASHYLYTGFSRTSKFSASATGLALTLSFGPGLYVHGDGADTDLGHPFELRTSAGLLWIFADSTRIGAHFSHLSNASITDTNPGTEMITVSYELPF
jgi:lipid A 3-O-deacylase